VKHLLTMTLLSVLLFANTQPYKKEIILKNEIDKPTLVGVALDNEIYAHATSDYRDIRLKSNAEERGYFIAKQTPHQVVNQKRLTAHDYNREEATLTYLFSTPFEVEKIRLDISDRNFESTFDVYADGKLVAKDRKIFDYSDETGTRNFIIKIPKVRVKALKVVYHLDKTTSFYKKYRDIKELSKYLTIRSITVYNNNHLKQRYDTTEIELLESHLDSEKKESSYIFKTQNIPFNYFEVEVLEQNFNRLGKLYFSVDGKEWRFVKNINISASTLNHTEHKQVAMAGKIPYVKMVLFNEDNKPLHLPKIKLYTITQYLYFIANPKEQYALYFGDKNLRKPNYEIANLVSNTQNAIEAKMGSLEMLEVAQKSVPKISFFEAHKEQLFILGIVLALLVMGYIAFGLLKRSE